LLLVICVMLCVKKEEENVNLSHPPPGDKG